MSPSLFIVPTPIGNLEDITLRALSVLKMVDMVLAEDTRKSITLLKHFNIEKPLRSFHQHNEHRILQRVVEEIQSGSKMALISDAGTPGISDPGFMLVRACVEAGVEVISLPGATALIPALVNSGLPSDRFCFEGFLPHKKGRKKRLEELQAEKRTMVFYESPHRIIKALEEFRMVFGEDRKASASRELSKIYEETIRGSLLELIMHFTTHPPKGEFVLVVSGAEK
jgi:16S rRNA (cytidine1402-2'-O)-methyltransferase